MEHRKLKNQANLYKFVLILFFIFGLMLSIAAVTVSAVDFKAESISVTPYGDCPTGVIINYTVSKVIGTHNSEECIDKVYIYLDGSLEPFWTSTEQTCIFPLNEPVEQYIFLEDAEVGAGNRNFRVVLTDAEDTNPDNNDADTTYNFCPTARADLTVTDIIFLPSGSPIQEGLNGTTCPNIMTITATINNTGGRDAENVNVSFNITDDMGRNVTIDSVFIERINAKKSEDRFVIWNLSSRIVKVKGDHDVIVSADPNNVIDEGLRENNNEMTVTITTCPIPPDIFDCRDSDEDCHEDYNTPPLRFNFSSIFQGSNSTIVLEFPNINTAGYGWIVFDLTFSDMHMSNMSNVTLPTNFSVNGTGGTCNFTNFDGNYSRGLCNTSEGDMENLSITLSTSYDQTPGIYEGWVNITLIYDDLLSTETITAYVRTWIEIQSIEEPWNGYVTAVLCSGGGISIANFSLNNTYSVDTANITIDFDNLTCKSPSCGSDVIDTTNLSNLDPSPISPNTKENVSIVLNTTQIKLPGNYSGKFKITLIYSDDVMKILTENNLSVNVLNRTHVMDASDQLSTFGTLAPGFSATDNFTFPGNISYYAFTFTNLTCVNDPNKIIDSSYITYAPTGTPKDGNLTVPMTLSVPIDAEPCNYTGTMDVYYIGITNFTQAHNYVPQCNNVVTWTNWPVEVIVLDNTRIADYKGNDSLVFDFTERLPGQSSTINWTIHNEDSNYTITEVLFKFTDMYNNYTTKSSPILPKQFTIANTDNCNFSNTGAGTIEGKCNVLGGTSENVSITLHTHPLQDEVAYDGRVNVTFIYGDHPLKFRILQNNIRTEIIIAAPHVQTIDLTLIDYGGMTSGIQNSANISIDFKVAPSNGIIYNITNINAAFTDLECSGYTIGKDNILHAIKSELLGPGWWNITIETNILVPLGTPNCNFYEGSYEVNITLNDPFGTVFTGTNHTRVNVIETPTQPLPTKIIGFGSLTAGTNNTNDFYFEVDTQGFPIEDNNVTITFSDMECLGYTITDPVATNYTVTDISGSGAGDWNITVHAVLTVPEGQEPCNYTGTYTVAFRVVDDYRTMVLGSNNSEVEVIATPTQLLPTKIIGFGSLTAGTNNTNDFYFEVDTQGFLIEDNNVTITFSDMECFGYILTDPVATNYTVTDISGSGAGDWNISVHAVLTVPEGQEPCNYTGTYTVAFRVVDDYRTMVLGSNNSEVEVIATPTQPLPTKIIGFGSLTAGTSNTNDFYFEVDTQGFLIEDNNVTITFSDMECFGYILTDPVTTNYTVTDISGSGAGDWNISVHAVLTVPEGQEPCNYTGTYTVAFRVADDYRTMVLGSNNSEVEVIATPAQALPTKIIGFGSLTAGTNNTNDFYFEVDTQGFLIEDNNVTITFSDMECLGYILTDPVTTNYTVTDISGSGAGDWNISVHAVLIVPEGDQPSCNYTGTYTVAFRVADDYRTMVLGSNNSEVEVIATPTQTLPTKIIGFGSLTAGTNNTNDFYFEVDTQGFLIEDNNVTITFSDMECLGYTLTDPVTTNYTVTDISGSGAGDWNISVHAVLIVPEGDQPSCNYTGTYTVAFRVADDYRTMVLGSNNSEVEVIATPTQTLPTKIIGFGSLAAGMNNTNDFYFEVDTQGFLIEDNNVTITFSDMECLGYILTDPVTTNYTVTDISGSGAGDWNISVHAVLTVPEGDQPSCNYTGTYTVTFRVADDYRTMVLGSNNSEVEVIATPTQALPTMLIGFGSLIAGTSNTNDFYFEVDTQGFSIEDNNVTITFSDMECFGYTITDPVVTNYTVTSIPESSWNISVHAVLTVPEGQEPCNYTGTYTVQFRITDDYKTMVIGSNASKVQVIPTPSQALETIIIDYSSVPQGYSQTANITFEIDTSGFDIYNINVVFSDLKLPNGTTMYANSITYTISKTPMGGGWNITIYTTLNVPFYVPTGNYTGTYTVSFRVNDSYNTLVMGTNTTKVEVTEAICTITTLDGYVKSSEGEVIEGANIIIINNSNNQPTGYSTTTGPGGYYSIDVPIGNYTLNVSATGYSPNATVTIDTGNECRISINITLGSICNITAITGYMKDNSGIGIRGIAIDAIDKSNDQLVDSTTTGPGGYYRVNVPNPGSYIINATITGYGWNSTTVDDIDAGLCEFPGVNLTFWVCDENYAAIIGRVISAGGEGIPYAIVEALNYSLIDFDMDSLNNSVITFKKDVVSTTTDINGYFVMYLPRGEYILNASFGEIHNTTDMNNPIDLTENCHVDVNISLQIPSIVKFEVIPQYRQCGLNRDTNVTFVANEPELVKKGNVTITDHPPLLSFTGPCESETGICVTYNPTAMGTYNYVLNYVDIYGNSNSTNGSFEVKNDDSPPDITLTEISKNLQGDLIITVTTILDANPVTVTAKIIDLNNNNITSITLNEIEIGLNIYQGNISGLTHNNYMINITASDSCGNDYNVAAGLKLLESASITPPNVRFCGAGACITNRGKEGEDKSDGYKLDYTSRHDLYSNVFFKNSDILTTENVTNATRTQLTDNITWQESRSVAFKNDKYYTAYESWESGQPDIYVREFDPATNSIETKAVLKTSAKEYSPYLHAMGNYFYLAYVSSSGEYLGDIYIAKYNLNWNPYGIFKVAGDKYTQGWPALTDDGKKLYLAYQSNDEDNYQNIYVQVINLDTLGPEGSPIKLTDYSSESITVAHPSILYANNKFYVAYQLNTMLDKEIELHWDTTTTDPPKRFILKSNLTDYTIYINEYDTSAFTNPTTYNMTRKVEGHGRIFSNVKNPFLSYQNNSMYVSYDFSEFGDEVYVRKYYESFDDTPITPDNSIYDLYLKDKLAEMAEDSPLPLTEPIKWTLRNDVLFVNDTYYLAYVSDGGDMDISLKIVDNITKSIMDKPLITETGDQYSPSLYNDDDNNYIIYVDKGDIKVRKYDSNWNSPEDLLVINGLSVQGSPTLFIHENNFYVAYISNRTGDRNVYVNVYNSSWKSIRNENITNYTEAQLNHTPQINPSVTYANNSFYVAYELSNAIIPSEEVELTIFDNVTKQDFKFRVVTEMIKTQLYITRFSSNWTKIEQYDQEKDDIQKYTIYPKPTTLMTYTDLYKLFLKNSVDEIDKLMGTSAYIELEDSVNLKKHSVAKNDDAYYFAYESGGDISLKIYNETSKNIVTISSRITSASSPALYFKDNYLYIAYVSGGNVHVGRLANDLTFTANIIPQIPNAKSASISFFNDRYYVAYVSNNRVYVREYDTNWALSTTHTMTTPSIPAGVTLDVPPAVVYKENSGNIYVIYQSSNKSSSTPTSSKFEVINPANNEIITFNSAVEVSDILFQVNKFNSSWAPIGDRSIEAGIETDRNVYITYTDIQVTGGKDSDGREIGIIEERGEEMQGISSCVLKPNDYSFVYNSQIRDMNRYNLPTISVTIAISDDIDIGKMGLSSSPKLFDPITLNSSDIVGGYISEQIPIPGDVKVGIYTLTLTIENKNKTSRYVIDLGNVNMSENQEPIIGNLSILNYENRTNTFYTGEMLFVSVDVNDADNSLSTVRAFFNTYYYENGTIIYGDNTTVLLGDPDMDDIFDNDGKTGEFGTELGSRFTPYVLPINITGKNISYSVDVHIVALDMCCNENVLVYTFNATQRPEPPEPSAPGRPSGGSRPPVVTYANETAGVIGGWGANITKILKLVVTAPETVNPNETFEILVTEENETGNPVPNATVIVYWTDGATTTSLTNNEGKIYVSSGAYGKINTTAEKKAYTSAYDYGLTKILRLELNIDFPGEMLTDEEFEVIVTDINNDLVEGAVITVTLPDGTTLDGTTGVDGKVKFKSGDLSGAITMVATKESYISAEDTSNINKRTLVVDAPDNVDIGREILIMVIDEGRNPIANANVVVILPDGTTKEYTSDSNGIVKAMSNLAGTIEVTATKEGYTDNKDSTFVIEPPVSVDFTKYILLICLLVLILFVLLLLLRGKVKVTKTKVNGTITVKVKNGTRGKLSACILEDTIPLGAEVDVLTIGVRKIDSKLLWDLGNIPGGEERVMEYKITGIEEVKEKAKLTWIDGEVESS